ncbi:MAG: AIR synthase-related protein, partial [Bdellovibrionales bacterium]|nr:AIR synthase-related protein [Bdellovibrionales bacterium]
ISGTVRFYNETYDDGISPTPSTGLVGLRPTVEDIPQSTFQKEGDLVYLISLGTSKTTGFQAESFGEDGKIEFTEDLNSLSSKTFELTQLVQQQKPKATRIVGNYGLANTLSRMCADGKGVSIDCDKDYFSESFYQVVVSIEPGEKEKFQKALDESNLDYEMIGSVGGNEMKWNELNMGVDKLQKTYQQSWQKAFPQLS